MKTGAFSIYAFLEPKGGIAYVGRTKDVAARQVSHVASRRFLDCSFKVLRTVGTLRDAVRIERQVIRALAKRGQVKRNLYQSVEKPRNLKGPGSKAVTIWLTKKTIQFLDQKKNETGAMKHWLIEKAIQGFYNIK